MTFMLKHQTKIREILLDPFIATMVKQGYHSSSAAQLAAEKSSSYLIFADGYNALKTEVEPSTEELRESFIKSITGIGFKEESAVLYWNEASPEDKGVYAVFMAGYNYAVSLL